MITKRNVHSFHILEREGSNNLITWNYPTISENIRSYLQAKCFDSVKNEAFFILRKNDVKVYVKQCDTGKKRFAIILLAAKFEYNSFRILSEVLANHYLKNFNPVDLVKVYLKLSTTGFIDVQENGTQKSCYDFKNFKEETKIKDLISRFGLEVIFLYTALLLKRRILVYHDDVEKVQKELYTICSMISARNMQTKLYPFVENGSELRGLPWYLAGTTNGNLFNNENLYDIYVNLALNDIAISSEAKDSFVISKTQKELAENLIKCLEEECSESEIKKFIDERTSKLFDQLMSLCNFSAENRQKMLTIEVLKAKAFKPALENFLFNLAVSEDRIVL